MQKIAMRAVQLDEVETCRERALRRGLEGEHEIADLGRVQLMGRLPAFAQRDRARRYRPPAGLFPVERKGAAPSQGRAALALRPEWVSCIPGAVPWAR